ncbi:ABC-2 transporter permease [Anaeromicropila herbilytica]|uniref:Transporter n=1 Tax=Anaeromicropila herbilytica TaxID=2785025 RepID=A0A7R7EI40_9FIRM|nr:ABC-2 transporter permease [Anaeromicropila herbilytica]BCN28862.1 transporter [Anaeromicropila herbilytica]
MLGLIFKDVLVNRKYLRNLLLLVVFYFIFGLFTNNIMFASYMIIFLGTFIVFATFSYDDLAKWDSYALSLPITRSEIVLSKYILAIGCSAIGSVFSLITSALYKVSKHQAFVFEDYLSIGVSFEVCIVILSLMTPIILKVGMEKARLALFVIFGIPAILVVLLVNNLHMQIPSEATIRFYISLTPIATILIFIASIALSIFIYNRKEI